MTKLADNKVYQALNAEAGIFGAVEVREYVTHFHISLSKLVEMRGDGLRSTLSGFGMTRDEALNDLWKQATAPNRFVTVSIAGFDYNYGWDGEDFIRLYLTDGDPLTALAAHIAEKTLQTSDAANDERPYSERWAVSCGCNKHGDHLGCTNICIFGGCTHPIGMELSAATEEEADRLSGFYDKTVFLGENHASK